MEKEMKGIILAGGSGTRLHPITYVYSKQLIPIYDKPMIYYPLSILMLSGLRDIIIVTTPQDRDLFFKLLGNGERLGLNLSYIIQEAPRGLPEAFILSKNEIANEKVIMILGDNLFYGDTFINTHIKPVIQRGIPTVFAHKVKDPRAYGVVEFDRDTSVKSLEEKPTNPKSNYAITGLYFFDEKVSEYAASLKPSQRGELEIVDLMKKYYAEKNLQVEILGRGTAWLDSGTHESLLSASTFIQTIEKRQGLKVACLEEIALRMGYMDLEKFEKIAHEMKGEYGDYLKEVAKEERAQ